MHSSNKLYLFFAETIDMKHAQPGAFSFFLGSSTSARSMFWAHEIGHQILASPPMGTAELGTCNGGTFPDIAVFTGSSADGVDIHWSPAAATALDKTLNPYD